MIKWKYDIRMGILGIIQSKKDGTKCVIFCVKNLKFNYLGFVTKSVHHKKIIKHLLGLSITMCKIFKLRKVAGLSRKVCK